MAALIAASTVASVVALTLRPRHRALMGHRGVRARVDAMLRSAAVDASPVRVLRAWFVAVGVAGASGAVVAGPALAAIAAVLVGAAPCALLASRRGRAELIGDRVVPDLLEAAAGGLRAGGSLRSALVDATRATGGPTCLDLASSLARDERPLSGALAQWERSHPTRSVHLAAAALSLASETGGAAARTLDRVASTIREQHALQHEVRALSTQARASALVLGIAPVAFGAVLGLLDPTTFSFLLTTGVGQVCLVVGVGLDAMGLLWMQRLTGMVQQ